MIRAILSDIASTPWRAYLAMVFELAGMACIVVCLYIIAVGFGG